LSDLLGTLQQMHFNSKCKVLQVCLIVSSLSGFDSEWRVSQPDLQGECHFMSWDHFQRGSATSPHWRSSTQWFHISALWGVMQHFLLNKMPVVFRGNTWYFKPSQWHILY